MDSNHIWILIGKKLTDEASAEELYELDLLMTQGLGDIYPLHTLEELWKANPTTPPTLFNKAVNEKWQRFENRLNELENETNTEVLQQPNTGYKFWKVTAAASLLALCLISTGIFFWYRSVTNTDDNHMAEVTAPASGISKIQLPDGTKVWLNAGSKLIYKNHFGEKFRQVSLIGEAYFDVVKDASHPFIVTTSAFKLKVLGTAFNVRSYPNDKTSEAALVRGKIEVSLNSSPDKLIVLKPSEKLTIKNAQSDSKKYFKKLHVVQEETPLITLSNIHQSVTDTLPSEALWMENRLAFDADSFDEIAQKMERWYKVSITFKNNDIKNLRFTGEFKNESLVVALQSLQATSSFKFTIQNDHVTLY